MVKVKYLHVKPSAESIFLALVCMFLVLGFGCPSFFWGFESTVLEKKLRDILGKNEVVKSFIFRDTVGANTGFNLQI